MNNEEMTDDIMTHWGNDELVELFWTLYDDERVFQAVVGDIMIHLRGRYDD